MVAPLSDICPEMEPDDFRTFFQDKRLLHQVSEIWPQLQDGPPDR